MDKLRTIAMFFLLHLASIFAIFPERMMASSSKGHWMAVIVLFAVELTALWFYLKALSLFPGKSVEEVCRAIMGRWGARLVLLPLLFFVALELVLLTYYQAAEIKTVLLRNTPITAISALFVSICMYGAWKGLTAMLRASIGWVILSIPFLLFSMVISFENFQFHYIFPIWDSGMSFLFHPDFYVGTVIFAGYLFLGATSPAMRIGFGTAAATLGTVFVFALVSVYIPLLVFGQETAEHLQYPMLMASDTVDLEWVIFDWLPSFYVVSSSGLGVVKVSVLLWLFVTIVKKMFLPKADKRWILVIACVLLYATCQRIPNAAILDRYLYLNTYFCMYATVGFPILVYFTARLRRKKAAV